MLQYTVDKNGLNVVVGADDSIEKSDVLITIGNLVVVLHEHHADFVNEIIYQALVFVDEYDMTVASARTRIGKIYHRFGFTGSFTSNYKVYHHFSFLGSGFIA
jgi:hypothetical protein